MAKPGEQAEHSVERHHGPMIDTNPARPEGAAQDPAAPQEKKPFFRNGLLKGLLITALVIVGVVGLFAGGLGSGNMGLFTVNNFPVTTIEGGITEGLSKAFEFLVKSPIAWTMLAAGGAAGVYHEYKKVNAPAPQLADTAEHDKIRELTQELEYQKGMNQQLANALPDRSAEQAQGPAAPEQAPAQPAAQTVAQAPQQPKEPQQLASEQPVQSAADSRLASADVLQPAPVLINHTHVNNTQVNNTQLVDNTQIDQSQHHTQVTQLQNNGQINQSQVNNQVNTVVASASVNANAGADMRAQGEKDSIYLRGSRVGDQRFQAAELKRRVERAASPEVKTV